MSSNSFNVITYNQASGFGDYLLAYPVHDENGYSKKNKDNKDNKDAEKIFGDEWNEAKNKVAELLIDKADVFLLQECNNIDGDTPFIKKLREKNFCIISSENRQDPNESRLHDAVIAISKKRFKDIRNLSDSDDIYSAYATAIDKKTGKKIIFLSAHPQGFRLCNNEGILSEEAIIKEGTVAFGDEDVKNFAEKLENKAQFADVDMQIIGADMNAFPEIWRKRFDYFTDKKFELLRTGKSTAFNGNPGEKALAEREIDFMFYKYKTKKKSFFEKIKSFFCKTIKNITVECHPSIGKIEWGTTNNPSDHIPVLSRVTYEMEDSKISQLFSSAIKSIRSLFSSKGMTENEENVEENPKPENFDELKQENQEPKNPNTIKEEGTKGKEKEENAGNQD